IREELAPCARGFDVVERERIWQTLFALTHASRDRKTLMEAIACVDCALWDVAGRAERRSVCELLGGVRRALPIITIGGYYREGKTLADLGREMEAYRAAGMAGCKFKVGGLAPQDDAARVAVARRAAAAVRMAHHEEPQIAQHLLAGVPHGTYVECFADPERDPVWQALWANRPPIKNGVMDVSPGPGFGLVLDEALVRRYRSG